jgi:predicted AlkP superfamily phosphohydrolase/phosphomutase
VHQPAAPPALRTIISRWYEAIDAVIGRLTTGLDSDTAVIVLSDHGGGPAPLRQLNLNAFLRERGYLARAGRSRARVAIGLGRLLERYHSAIPGRVWLKDHLSGSGRRLLGSLRNATGAVLWERTRAYARPIYYPVTGIWINVAGRQQRGTVAPGMEYEALRAALTREISDLRDPETGVSPVARVAYREEVYAGPHLPSAPDLIVEMVAGYHGGLDLEELVTTVPDATLRNASGSHTAEGLFVAAGGPFRQGLALDAPSLADVLPTALHLLGTPLPDDLDGRVLEEALDAAYLTTSPVRLIRASQARDDHAVIGDADEAEMRKFLQGLGYIE